MRGTVAKRIRRQIYGDKVFKNQDKYLEAQIDGGRERRIEKPMTLTEKVNSKLREFWVVKAYKLINPQRLAYREAKKAYYRKK